MWFRKKKDLDGVDMKDIFIKSQELLPEHKPSHAVKLVVLLSAFYLILLFFFGR